MLTPYVVARYVAPVFPYFVMFAALSVDQVLRAIMKSMTVGYMILLLLFIMPEVTILRGGIEDYNREIMDTVSSEHSHDICLFNTEIVPEENIFELRKFERIYTYDGSGESLVPEIADARELVVYVPEEIEEESGEEEYLQTIMGANPKLSETERLYVAYDSTCYLMAAEDQ